MVIYLDNAATTVNKYPVTTEYFNPNSTHKLGQDASIVLDKCRAKIKQCLGLNYRDGKLMFCRSASEAVWRLCERANQTGGYLLCSHQEHDSIYQAVEAHDASWSDYYVDFHQLTNQLTGKENSLDMMSKGEDWYIASDFTAAIGKTYLPRLDDIDALWFSAHKFHGPKGIGALWVSNRFAKRLGLTNNPTNEYGMFHGTQAVELAESMAEALQDAVSDVMSNRLNATNCDEMLQKYLNINQVRYQVFNSKFQTPCIRMYTFPGLDADTLVSYLSSKEIYISPAHSACAEEGDYSTAMSFGLTEEQARQSVRISYDIDTNPYDMKLVADTIKEFSDKF